MADQTFDALRSLRQDLGAGQNKYAYFLLTAAGAGIALAVNRTVGATPSLTQLPLAAAVVSWGCSFYFGCDYVVLSNLRILRDFDMLLVQTGRHELVPKHPQAIQAAAEVLGKHMDLESKKSNRASDLQFRLLVAGACLYVIWHVLEMFRAAGYLCV